MSAGGLFGCRQPNPLCVSTRPANQKQGATIHAIFNPRCSCLNLKYFFEVPREPALLFFLPADYPREAVLHNLAFWSEQYLLQALLMFNAQFEVL